MQMPMLMALMLLIMLMRITVLIMLMTNFGGRTIQHLHDQLCCDHNDHHNADDCNDYISLIIIVIVYCLPGKGGASNIST